MRPSTLRHAARLALLTCLVAAVVAPLAGCGLRKGGLRSRLVYRELQHRVPVEGLPITLGRFTAFEIDNPGGSVTIIAAERHEEARISFDIRDELAHRSRALDEGWEYDFRGAWFNAVHEVTNETGVVRIDRTDRRLADGTRPVVDITIRTPVCDGLVVRNRGGKVFASGVRGAISVVSDSEVEVRSADSVVDPVSLRSSESVTLVVPPVSSGTLLLSAPKGRATFNSRWGRTEDARPKYPGEYTGIWNSGANPITLQSEEGNATLLVSDQPTKYATIVQW